MVSGIVGAVFRPFAITLACALLASLVVAVTVIPMLAKILVLRGAKNVKAHDETKPSRFTSFYENVLKWTLMNRIKTLLISGLLFVVTLAATIPMLNVSFLPSSEASRTMYFSLKFPYETSFEATDEKTRELENMLMETKDSRGEPVFKFVEGLVGYSGNDDERTPYASQIYLEVNENVDPDKVKEQVKAFIVSELPQGSEVEPRSLGNDFGGTTTDFSYSLKGEDQDQLVKAAALVKEKLHTFPELSEIEDNLSDAKTEVEIAVDQKKARAYGLTAQVCAIPPALGFRSKALATSSWITRRTRRPFRSINPTKIRLRSSATSR